MTGVLSAEWRRLRSNPLFRLILTMLVLIQAVLTARSLYQDSYPERDPVFRSLLQEAAALPAEDVAEQVRAKREEAEIVIHYLRMVSLAERGEAILMPDEVNILYEENRELIDSYLAADPDEREAWLHLRLQVYASLSERLAHVTGYSESIASRLEDTESKLGVSVFAKPGTFSYRSLQNSLQDFQKLGQLELRLGPEDAYTALTRLPAADWFFIFFLFLLVWLVMAEEQELGLQYFLRSHRVSIQHITAWRMVFTVLVTAAAAAVIWGLTILWTGLYLGFGDLSRPVQSIRLLSGSVLSLSAGEYLMAFLLLKILTYTAIAVLFILILAVFRSRNSAFIVSFGLLGINAACFSLIRSTSPINALRVLNVFAILNPAELLGSYYHVNLMSFAVPRYPAALLYIFIIALFCCGMAIYSYAWPEFDGLAVRSSALCKNTNKKIQAESYRKWELRRLVWPAGALIISAVLVLALVDIDRKPLVYTDEDRATYLLFLKETEGPVNDRTGIILKEQAAPFEQQTELMAEIDAALASGKLSASDAASQRAYLSSLSANQGDIFHKYQSEVKRLLELYRAGYKVHVTDLEADAFWFDQDNQNLFFQLILNVAVILAVTAVPAMDQRCRMLAILQSTAVGHKHLIRLRLAAAAILSMLFTGILAIPDMVNAVRLRLDYPLNAVIQSAPSLGDSQLLWTMKQLLVFEFALSLAAAAVSAWLILAFVQWLRHPWSAMLTSALALMLPPISNRLGASVFAWLPGSHLAVNAENLAVIGLSAQVKVFFILMLEAVFLWCLNLRIWLKRNEY